MFAKCWWLDVSDSKMLECIFGVEQVFVNCVVCEKLKGASDMSCLVCCYPI